jgi:hypothetical protein
MYLELASHQNFVKKRRSLLGKKRIFNRKRGIQVSPAEN